MGKTNKRYAPEMRVMPSMGSVGDAYDNAMAESFFATLEREVLQRRSFKTQVEGRMAVFEWIEGWYNPHRRHSSRIGLVPLEPDGERLVAYLERRTPWDS
jgi:putative transposase